MRNTNYDINMFNKIKRALSYYVPHAFEKLGDVENVLGYETKEHLRTPPCESLYAPVSPGHAWGGEYSNLWLHAHIKTPDAAVGRILFARPNSGGIETLCFKNGNPAGIVNTKGNFFGGLHHSMYLSFCAKEGEEFTVDFECYAGHEVLGDSVYENYGKSEASPSEFNRTYTGVELYTTNEIIHGCILDLHTVLHMFRDQYQGFLHKKVYNAVIEAYPYFILDPINYSHEEIEASAKKIREIIAPVLEKGPQDHTRGRVSMIGHSHLDTAWLWPVAETVRKAARTFSQALEYMEAYPEYKFLQSSALHLDWMREYYPDIFRRIKEKVAEGRYEPNGGVWVECDCNITGGESMIRQFLYGQRFTREHFGYTSDSFWLPDTFGYNAAIPQIMLGCNVKNFFTTKISWNDLNKFPYDTFVWRGIDGSEVLTHFNTIAAFPDPSQLYTVIDNIPDKDLTDMHFLAFGFGDGGGGPTAEMLESIRRIESLPGLPEVKMSTASEFMQEVEEFREKLPIYDGELYLELHRGTLTQMHDIKKNNRMAEFALRDMEFMNVVSGEKRNVKTDELYKVMLKNQFHDILPGTSLKCVNELTRKEMTELIASARGISCEYADSFVDTSSSAVTLFNTLSFDRDDIALLDGEYSFTSAPSQTYVDHDENKKTAVSVSIPAFSALSLEVGDSKESEQCFCYSEGKLETPFYSAIFDSNGYISSLNDKRVNRRVERTEEHPLGRLMIAEDVSMFHDNWEMDSDIFMKFKPVAASAPAAVVSSGAVEFRLRTEYPIGKNSTATVDTVFYASSPRIDFEMTVDWDEPHTMLKASFDVDVRSATCKNEIQFGHIERPTTKNNTFEKAKFEVCNHKWSALSESRYGVALLNNCKYGISVDDSHMMLTLHKGGNRPDTTNDRGRHSFTYSLLPYVGAFSAENVIHPAYELNSPAFAVSGSLENPLYAPVTVSEPNIICESIKVAEDIEGAYVLRLYECERNRTNCTLTFPKNVQVYETNMLEEIKEELQVSENSCELEFRPFEIKTLLVNPIK